MLKYRFLARGICALVLGTLLVIAAVPGAGAAAIEPPRTLGVYRGSGAPDAVDTFGTWLGTEPAYALDFLARQSWADIENVDWWLQSWADSPQEVVFSVPMLPATGASLAQGAAGAYNDTFTRLAQRFVDHGRGDAIIRLGWEFNGSWYSWSAINDPTTFAAYWRQIVSTMRSVARELEFDWNPNLESSPSFALELAYPGDAYVDFIGMDVYDHGWAIGWEDPIRRWDTMVNQPYGLLWHRNFAAIHSKPVSFPEWALSQRSDGHGGGDNPYFVERMHEWITNSNAAYHMYFEYDVSADEHHEMMSGHFPSAAARFIELFGPVGTLTTNTTVVESRLHRRTRR